MKNMLFKSLSYEGKNNTVAVMDKIIDRIKDRPDSEWTLAIGTDSQNKGNSTKFCQVILLHEKTKGGQFFYAVQSQERIKVIQHRMLEESRMSIDTGRDVLKFLEDKFIAEEFDYIEHKVNLEIHCDLGANGKSRDSIKTAIGWITAEFGGLITPRVKPHSCAASHIADIYTK